MKLKLFLSSILITLTTVGLVWSQQGGGIQGGGGGTVKSVGLSAPALFTVSGSPVTGTGTLALTYSGTALPVANGGTNLTAATDDTVPTGNGTTWEAKAVPNCGDATHALAYATSTNSWSCQVITGSGGVSQTTGTFNAQWVNGCSDDPTSVFSYVQTGNSVTIQINNSVTCASDATQKSTAAGAVPVGLRPARVQSLKYTDIQVAAVDTEICLTIQVDGQIQMHTGASCGTNPGNSNLSIVATSQTALTYLTN